MSYSIGLRTSRFTAYLRINEICSVKIFSVKGI